MQDIMLHLQLQGLGLALINGTTHLPFSERSLAGVPKLQRII